jgi:hypothetical protein
MCFKTARDATQSKTRLTAMLLCVCFFAAVLFSAAFILTHAAHTHDSNASDGSCAVCACVAAAKKTLITVSGAAAMAGIALLTLFGAYTLLAALISRAGVSSLVKLKIRLDN